MGDRALDKTFTVMRETRSLPVCFISTENEPEHSWRVLYMLDLPHKYSLCTADSLTAVSDTLS
jgi:hypothetical protein